MNDYLFKLLIIGDSGVGKSSLLLRYIQIICVGTKSDLPHERQVDKSEVITFVDTNNFLYLETSSKNITNVDKMFNLIVENIISTQTNNVIPTPPPYKQKVLF